MSSHRLFRAVLALAATCVLGQAAPAAAAHRARLSADLAQHLAGGSQRIDVIVHGTRAEVDALARRYNLRVKRYLRSGAVLRVTAGQLAALQEDESQAHLSSDLLIRSTADVTAETIGADQVWAGAGALRRLTGRGVGIAVIDSGIDTTHAALRGRVVTSVDFTGGDGMDRFGHGTHVAALIAGQGGRTADTDDYRGMASNAHLISLRVLGDDGSGLASSVIEALDWVVEHRREHNIRIVNLSLGAPVLQPYRDDPLCEAVERAVAAGIVVIAAAGNHGLTADGRRILGGITSPANHPAVITIGALDTKHSVVRSDDTVASFSSRGPTMYDLVLKPDLVAPGVRVVSAEAAGSYLSRTFPARHVAGSGSNGFIELSGTSMSAGVVSGTVALLLEERPNLGPRDVKTVLQVSSSLMPEEGLIAAGAGSLNALAAGQVALGSLVTSTTFIAEQKVVSGNVTFATAASRSPRRHRNTLIPMLRVSAKHWADDTIVWGSAIGDDTIVRGSNADDTIVWGSYSDDTIVWGSSIDDTIVWGSGLADDTIVWGSQVDDTIVWGSAVDQDTIVWGSAL